MDEKPTQLEVRFAGGGVNPSTVKARDLAKILVAVEEVIVSMAVDNGASQEEVLVGLVGIQDQSLGLAFSSPIQNSVKIGIEKLVAAIARSDFIELPYQALEGLRDIVNFTKKTHSRAEIKYAESTNINLATIDSDTEIPEVGGIRGLTSLYGKVLRIGGQLGKNKQPKLMLQALNGRIVYCTVPLPIAKQLGSRLYSVVGLDGEAIYSNDGLNIKYFIVHDVLPYQETSITDAFQDLADIVGDYFETIEDIDEYIAQLQGEEE